MADLLIRGLSDEVVAAIDAKAKRMGLSRTEYLRRSLAGNAAASSGPVTSADLSRFAETFSDLGDPDIMRQAWE